MKTLNKIYLYKPYRFGIAFFLTLIILSSCNENATDFKLGEEYIETQTQLNLIDTMSVSLSTVLLDTVISSGTGRMLVGANNDDDFGEIVSSSYFQVGIPESFDVETGDEYDSLKLVITYDQYSFGDTLQEQKINVHRLTENIEPDEDGILSADMSFSYDPEPAGSIVYLPKPNSSIDTLAILLSDVIGNDLFMKIKEDSPVLGSNESFLDYLPGFVLISDASFESPIIGFSADAEDARLLLYSKRPSETMEQIIHEFKLEDAAKQYNHITHDFSAAKLNGLVEQYEEISSSFTDGSAYLQGGTSLTIRVNFPTLDQLFFLGRGSIVKAQLFIAVQAEFQNESSLPASLYLYQADKYNRILDSQGAVASSSLSTDELYNEATVYSFNITDYLNYELADSYIDPDTGLMLTLTSDQQFTTFEQLVLDQKNKNTKLKIYYICY